MTEEVKLSWGETSRLEIRYTGNLHGDLEGLPRLATVIKRERQAHPRMLLVDTGNFSAGNEVTEKFRGRPVAEVMQKLGFDAAVPGEDEIRWGLQGLCDLERFSGCPMLAANWKGSPLKGWTVVEKGDLKIRIVGLAHPTAPAGVETLPAAEAMKKALAGSEGGEVVVVISHLGFSQDRSLAMAGDEVHVILEGIPYEGFSQVTRMGDTLVVPAAPGVRTLGALGLDLSGALTIEAGGNE